MGNEASELGIPGISFCGPLSEKVGRASIPVSGNGSGDAFMASGLGISVLGFGGAAPELVAGVS